MLVFSSANQNTVLCKQKRYNQELDNIANLDKIKIENFLFYNLPIIGEFKEFIDTNRYTLEKKVDFATNLSKIYKQSFIDFIAECRKEQAKTLTTFKDYDLSCKPMIFSPKKIQISFGFE